MEEVATLLFHADTGQGMKPEKGPETADDGQRTALDSLHVNHNHYLHNPAIAASKLYLLDRVSFVVISQSLLVYVAPLSAPPPYLALHTTGMVSEKSCSSSFLVLPVDLGLANDPPLNSTLCWLGENCHQGRLQSWMGRHPSYACPALTFPSTMSHLRHSDIRLDRLRQTPNHPLTVWGLLVKSTHFCEVYQNHIDLPHRPMSILPCTNTGILSEDLAGSAPWLILSARKEENESSFQMLLRSQGAARICW